MGKLVKIPMKRYEDYLKYSLNKLQKKDKVSFMCDCGKMVENYLFPYAYDRKNNDVYFATICPLCNKLSLFKE